MDLFAVLHFIDLILQIVALDCAAWKRLDFREKLDCVRLDMLAEYFCRISNDGGEIAEQMASMVSLGKLAEGNLCRKSKNARWRRIRLVASKSMYQVLTGVARPLVQALQDTFLVSSL